MYRSIPLRLHNFQLCPRALVPELYHLLIGLGFWSLQAGGLTPLSLAQAPIIEPIPAETSQPLPPQVPLSTFNSTETPPKGYSPPLFDPKTSKQFNLYRLDIGDSINVNVRDYPEFSFAGLVDADGTVSAPLLGKIDVVGLTLDEVKTKIAYELGRRYLQTEPDVLTFLTTPRPAQVMVLGEVARPGFYTFTPQTPLNLVLTNSGGSTQQADLRSIIVRRPLVDGTVLEEKVDLYTPLIKGTRLPQFRLQGGDTIIVSKLQTGQTQDYDQNAIARTTLVKPTITVRILVQLQPYGRQLRSITLPTGSTAIELIGILPGSSPILMKQDEITLVRFDPEQGKVVTQILNPEALVLNGDYTQNVVLRDQDVILTSRTLYGEFLAGFSLLTEPIRTVLGLTNFVYSLPYSIPGGNNGYNRNNIGF